VIINLDREPPSEGGNADIAELIDHANELAAHGNPAGFFVGDGLSIVQPSWPITDEEYAACRTWIEANADIVRTAWRFGVGRSP
jgi:hypothetical protein